MTAVTVQVEYPDDRSSTCTFDPAIAIGRLWNDQIVLEIFVGIMQKSIHRISGCPHRL